MPYSNPLVNLHSGQQNPLALQGQDGTDAQVLWPGRDRSQRARQGGLLHLPEPGNGEGMHLDTCPLNTCPLDPGPHT